MGITERLVDFTIRTKFDDLPQAIVDKIKQALLDSIGCALGSYVVDRARLAIEFAEECGGNPQASIIGGYRTSCDLAAFVNGELINAMDYDCTGPLTGHVTPYVIPPCLAIAERVHASGKELITALALAHEIGGRVVSSLAQVKILKEEPPYYEESPRFSYSPTVFGGVAGAGKLLGLNARKMANAFGIAGASCPVLGGVRFEHIAEPGIMVKYNAWSGWIAQLATVAALLAERGFTGDTGILDDKDFGFWKIVGSPFFKVDNLLGKLGEYWYVGFKERGVEFKQYPCCRLNHTSVDAIKKIMREHKIKPEEIEEIIVKGDPILQAPIRTHAKVENFADTQFTNTYICAVAAYHGDSPGPAWQMPGTFNRPEIKALMSKVKIESHPRASELITTKIKAGILPTFRNSIVEIAAKGQRFSEEISAPKGTVSNPLTETELLEKFRNNASYSMLASNKVEEIIQMVSELEKLDDITKLAKLVTVH